MKVKLLIALLFFSLMQTAIAGEFKKSIALIQPLTEQDWTPEQKKIFAYLNTENADGKKPLNILGTIAHHPELLKAFMPWATVLGTNTVLSAKDLEILALRTIWHADSDYELGHHTDFGRDAGLTEKQMRNLRRTEPKKSQWTRKERLLIKAADELMTGTKIKRNTVEKLLAQYSKKELVEIIWIVNQYNSLSKFANSLNVQLEEVYFK